MNKNIALLSAVSAMVLAGSANALEFRPYVGAQYNVTHVSSKNSVTDVNMHSYSVFVGTEYNRFFGTEVFYQNSNKWHKEIAGVKQKADFAAYGLDGYAYLPLGCDRVFSLLATAGIANYDFDQSNAVAKDKDNGLGYRLGAGAQYNITNNIAVRALGRYIWTDKLDNMDHFAEFSMGLKYIF